MSFVASSSFSSFPSLTHPLANPSLRRPRPEGTLAWSAPFWIALQKEFHRPNVPDGLMEVDYLFRAMTKKKSNRIRIVKGGAAYWDDIHADDLARWRLGMTLWGWGSDKAIVWNDALDTTLLHASIRLYALHQDGPITRVMTKGALQRRRVLEGLVERGMQSAKWRMLKMEHLGLEERVARLNELTPEDVYRLGPDVRNMLHAYKEMNWKHRASGRIYQWLLRKGTIPLASVSEWLQAWQNPVVVNGADTQVAT